MPIYDIFEHAHKHAEQDDPTVSHFNLSQKYGEFSLGAQKAKEPPSDRSALFSTIAARLFFFMLFLADIAWGMLSVVLFFGLLFLNAATLFKVYRLKKLYLKRWLNIKRAFVCGISLFVALFSPALGTMFACTYFLMYDKKGIEEVVPSILQDQFREFFAH